MSLRHDAPAYCGCHISSHLEVKRNSDLFLFAFSDNLISEDWFLPKASGFYPFGDATALTGEGDVGDVVCLI